MQQALDTLSIGLYKIFMFPGVRVGVVDVVLPVVHQLVGFLRVFEDLLPVEVLFGQ